MPVGNVEELPKHDLPHVYKVKEVAGLLRIPLSRMYELVESGEIPCIRLGRSIRIPRSVVERLLNTEQHREVKGRDASA